MQVSDIHEKIRYIQHSNHNKGSHTCIIQNLSTPLCLNRLQMQNIRERKMDGVILSYLKLVFYATFCLVLYFRFWF